jgi:hypothetical protein
MAAPGPAVSPDGADNLGPSPAANTATAPSTKRGEHRKDERTSAEVRAWVCACVCVWGGGGWGLVTRTWQWWWWSWPRASPPLGTAAQRAATHRARASSVLLLLLLPRVLRCLLRLRARAAVRHVARAVGAHPPGATRVVHTPRRLARVRAPVSVHQRSARQCAHACLCAAATMHATRYAHNMVRIACGTHAPHTHTHTHTCATRHATRRSRPPATRGTHPRPQTPRLSARCP